ncbi:MAG: FtsQ-type POTRA domain-containing protein [Sporomusaceae bacterium]|nr:FtsQ-type POTRA domain-containing protein [Sporomusaceae bacterium]
MASSDPVRRSANPTKFALLLLAVLLSGFLLLQSSLFSIGSVQVQGQRYMSEEEVLRIAGIGDRINIFRLDTDSIKQRLLQDLRIADVAISRRLPGTVIISLRERQPVAFIATSYGFAQLDEAGMVLAAAKSIRQMNAPLITGHHIGGAYVGDQIEAPAVLAVLQYLSSLSEPTFRQMSEVHIDAGGNMTGYTVEAIRVKIGTAEDMAQKAVKTSAIFADSQKSLAQIDYIDVSYATAYVKFKQESELKKF